MNKVAEKVVSAMTAAEIEQLVDDQTPTDKSAHDCLRCVRSDR
jgi:hypothetical protein